MEIIKRNSFLVFVTDGLNNQVNKISMGEI